MLIFLLVLFGLIALVTGQGTLAAWLLLIAGVVAVILALVD